MNLNNLPPGCKAYTVSRWISDGQSMTFTVIAPTPQAASRIADERAAALREVR